MNDAASYAKHRLLLQVLIAMGHVHYYVCNAEKQEVIREAFSTALRKDATHWFDYRNRWRAITAVVGTAVVARYAVPLWEITQMMQLMQPQLNELGKAIVDVSGAVDRQEISRTKRAKPELPIDTCTATLHNLMGLRSDPLLPKREYPFSDNIAPALEFRRVMNEHLPDKVIMTLFDSGKRL